MARRNRKVEEEVIEEAPPAAPPPLVTPERGYRGLPILAAYLALALIVVLAVVLGGRWLYNRSQQEPNKQPTTATNQPPARPAPTTTRKPSGSGSNSTGQTPSGSQGSGQTNTPATGSQGGELAQTGPGDTVALFISTAIAMAALHYAVQLRRTKA